MSFGLKPGKEHQPMTKTKELIYLNLGVFLIAAGIYFFKIPNHLVMGGVSGIAVVFEALVPSVSASQFIFILNMALLLIGFLVFGRSFGLRTVYASVMMSVFLELFAKLVPVSLPLTNSPFLELMFAILLPGIGSGLLFNIHASSGGTDIVAMVLKKFTSVDIGNALLMTDIIFTLSTFFIYSNEIALMSLLGLMAKSFMVDKTMENINRVKMFFLITDKADEMIDFISVYLHRGGTRFEGWGTYSGEERSMILVVCSSSEASSLLHYGKEIDPNCFMSIVNTSEIMGKGFHFVE